MTDSLEGELYSFDASWVVERGATAPLAGADEAGRGALAGPIFAAGVVLGVGFIEGINDSKLLRPATRKNLFSDVLREAEAISVVSLPAWWIDAHGLGAANRKALRRSLELLEERSGCSLADGNLRLSGGIESLPRADSRSAAVAAASVVAKVLRDHVMDVLASGNPAYGFERNRGYGTAEHRAALAVSGPCRVHRLSYAGVEG